MGNNEKLLNPVDDKENLGLDGEENKQEKQPESELLRNFNFKDFIEKKWVPDDEMRVVDKWLLDNKYQNLPNFLYEAISV